MSEPLSNDPRNLSEAFERDKAGQAQQNAAANAANSKSYAARENQFDRPGVGQPGSFTQPGSSRKGR